MLEIGMWLQGCILCQLAMTETIRYWTGVALIFIPKVDPDNAGDSSARHIEK
jgi:hypothetical protein